MSGSVVAVAASFALNVLSLYVTTRLIDVGRKGLGPLVFAAVVGTLILWLVATVLSPTGSIGGWIAIFAMGGVYSFVLDVNMRRGFGIALVMLVVHLLLIVGLVHGGYMAWPR